MGSGPNREIHRNIRVGVRGFRWNGSEMEEKSGAAKESHPTLPRVRDSDDMYFLMVCLAQRKEGAMIRPNVASPTPRQIVASASMGAAIAVLGLFLLVYPLMAGRLPMGLLGWVLILVCMAQLVFALHSSNLWNFSLFALRGVLFGGAGGCLVYFRPSELEMVTALLMAMLLAGAGVEGGVALLLKPEDGREWVLFDAVTGFLMGALVLAGWPANSLWAMGTMVGVSVVVAGACRVALAARLQSRVIAVERVRVYQRAA